MTAQTRILNNADSDWPGRAASSGNVALIVTISIVICINYRIEEHEFTEICLDSLTQSPSVSLWPAGGLLVYCVSIKTSPFIFL